jgi:hypothetical protein
MKRSQLNIIKIGVTLAICLLGAEFPLRVLADSTAPTISISFPAPDGSNSWFITSPVGTVTANDNNVVNSITCTGNGLTSDAPIGIGTTNASMTIHVSGDGVSNISCTAMDDTISSAPATYTISIDTTPPTVTLTPAGTLGTNGWYISNVTITTSGIDISTPVTCDADQTVSTDTDSTTINGSCTNAAGLAGSGSLAIKRDTVGPVGVSVAADRGPDAGGYYNQPFTATWSATSDVTSGIASCTGRGYNGPDTTGSSFNGNCTDNAGNASAPVAFNFSYDSTAPTIAYVDRTASNTYGWNNTNVTVNWSCNDAISGVTPNTVSQTITTDGKDQAAIGTCTDAAGNSSTDTQAGINIDRSAPLTTGAPDRPADSNGWYNQLVNIVFTGVDALSEVASCSASIPYNGPDGTSILAGSGTCTDKAGNTSGIVQANPFNYDGTGPSFTIVPARSADHISWYNKPLSFDITNFADNLSGTDTCASIPNYSGPDGAAVSINGSCTDRAGNTTTNSININYDATAPINVVGNPARVPADKNGWYNYPVNIVFTGDGGPSGIAADGCTKTLFAGPDNETASVKGFCTDQAGNVSALVDSSIFKYDTTRPTVVPIKPPSSSGWYNTDVTITFTGTDSLSGIDTCTPASYTFTNEGKGQTTSGFCQDLAGNVSLALLVKDINIDKTPPIITYIGRAPAPDKNGWSYSPVTLGWRCTDALSGILLSPVTVEIDTEGKGLSATGTCQDIAGNTSSNTVDGINITFTLPTATPSPVPSSTATVPPTATVIPPSLTSTLVPMATATITIASPIPTISNTNGMPQSATRTSQSGQIVFFILGGIVVAGLFIWLIFFLLKKRKNK